MMHLTVEEAGFLMELIRREFGWGYSEHPAVGRLQAQLSIAAEVAHSLGRHSEEPFPEFARTQPNAK